MTTNERSIWNAKYAEGSHASREPDLFLVEAYENYVLPLLRPTPKDSELCALDIAGGVGRHAIWLAKRGFQSTLIDISDQAIAIAKQNSQAAGVVIDLSIGDAKTFLSDLATRFDLIVVFFFLQRELFPALIRQLKPGGLLIYKTYTAAQPKLAPGKGPTHPMHLLKPNELLHAFSSLEILSYRETVTDRGIAEMVARKKLV